MTDSTVFTGTVGVAASGLPADWPRRLPRKLRLFGGRRPLRVRPRDAAAEWADGVLRLEFELPAGSYATVLLEELFPEGFDEGPRADDSRGRQ